MKVRNSRVWTNGIHGEILENDKWIKFRVNSTDIYSDCELSEDTKTYLKKKFYDFWNEQEDNLDEV